MQACPAPFHWKSDLTMLQETRISAFNKKHLQREATKHGFALTIGKPLDLRITTNGTLKTPHGGVAALSRHDRARAFTASDDCTGLWHKLFQTGRVMGVWQQILPKVRLLCFCVYLQAGTLPDAKSANQEIMQDLLELTSQYGEVPVAICGDLQDHPMDIAAVASAINFGNWIDPLASTDSSLDRPMTYARDSNFAEDSSHTTSIDAILLNRVANAALTSIHVDYAKAKQHAPIMATFSWPSIELIGPVLVVPAPLNLSKVPVKDGKIDSLLLESIADKHWVQKYQSLCDSSDDASAWEAINQFALETLLEAGASFNPGPHTRATMPKFKHRKYCPGQMHDGSATSQKSYRLQKLHNKLCELKARISRPPRNHAEQVNLTNLCSNCMSAMQTIPVPIPQDLCQPEVLNATIRYVSDLITQLRTKEKFQRIQKWKKKMALGTTSKNVHSSVYKWINSRSAIQNSNQITDGENNLILDPTDAINHVQSIWDDIFGVNAGHQDPQTLLSFVWPYANQIRSECNVPPLTGAMLQTQACKRKVTAAAGLDGWRTVEAMVLPTKVWDAIAAFFQKVEQQERNLPQLCTMGRQVLLDKSGKTTPLDKRLICLLPNFLIAYTSLRFRHLVKWQQQVMPMQIVGAVKGRKMAQIAGEIQISLDNSRVQNCPIIGAKLDKSKAFDRLIPSVSGMLMLALGIPSTIVVFFLSMYQSMTRYTSYLQWTGATACTQANGLVQGCSMSLIAMNSHMAIWSCMMSTLQIQSRSFIDDSYIWTTLQNQQALEQAIAVTNMWDQLTGQLMNQGKSEVWSSHPVGRTALKTLFPQMSSVNILEVLGSRIQTTLKNNYAWKVEKTTKIVREAEAIALLPTSIEVKQHIVGTKLLPQLAFMPHINQVPKQDLRTIQAAILRIVWKDRPIWRSKWLVFGLLTKPWRVEPSIARAYGVINDTIAFLKGTTDSYRSIWLQQCSQPPANQNALVKRFLCACQLFNLTVHDGFHFSFLHSDPLPFLDLHFKDLKLVLQALARDLCYKYCADSPRKDILPVTGHLDFDATMLATKTFNHATERRLISYRESCMVGSLLTLDRKAALEKHDNNACRFCNQQKESMKHLIDCPKLQEQIPKPPVPENCGSNFPQHGIVEIDHGQIRERLRISSVAEIPVQPWSHDCHQITYFWTDGSVDHATQFWKTKGSFSVIGQDAQIVACGRVRHWAISAYSTELWALLQAFARATSICHIVSDCKSVVQQCLYLLNNHHVPLHWAHRTWWNFLLDLILARQQFHPKPLHITWIPAHLIDNTSDRQEIYRIALEKQVSFLDLCMNKVADQVAKNVLQPFANNDLAKQITLYQRWLVDVAVLLAQTQPESLLPVPEPPVSNLLTEASPLGDFERVYPLWRWSPNPNSYTWTSNFVTNTQKKLPASLSYENWIILRDFLLQCKWLVHQHHKTSYLELAYLFNDQGGRLRGVTNSPSKTATLLRKAICYAGQVQPLPRLSIQPGIPSIGCKANGKVHTSGYLDKALVYLPVSALRRLAVHFQGRSHSLKLWEFPF